MRGISISPSGSPTSSGGSVVVVVVVVRGGRVDGDTARRRGRGGRRHDRRRLEASGQVVELALQLVLGAGGLDARAPQLVGDEPEHQQPDYDQHTADEGDRPSGIVDDHPVPPAHLPRAGVEPIQAFERVGRRLPLLVRHVASLRTRPSSEHAGRQASKLARAPRHHRERWGRREGRARPQQNVSPWSPCRPGTRTVSVAATSCRPPSQSRTPWRRLRSSNSSTPSLCSGGSRHSPACRCGSTYRRDRPAPRAQRSRQDDPAAALRRTAAARTRHRTHPRPRPRHATFRRAPAGRPARPHQRPLRRSHRRRQRSVLGVDGRRQRRRDRRRGRPDGRRRTAARRYRSPNSPPASGDAPLSPASSHAGPSCGSSTSRTQGSTPRVATTSTTLLRAAVAPGATVIVASHELERAGRARHPLRARRRRTHLRRIVAAGIGGRGAVNRWRLAG